MAKVWKKHSYGNLQYDVRRAHKQMGQFAISRRVLRKNTISFPIHETTFSAEKQNKKNRRGTFVFTTAEKVTLSDILVFFFLTEYHDA